MALTIRKITNICRLCLSEELDSLIPAKDVFDSSLTPDDVERFTGVQVSTDDSLPYVFCTFCRNSLRKSVAFRCSCLQNDRLYRQLFSELILQKRHETKSLQSSIVQQAENTVNDLNEPAASAIEIHGFNYPDSRPGNMKQELFVSCDEDLIEFGDAADEIVEAIPSKTAVGSSKSKQMARQNKATVSKKEKTLTRVKHEVPSDGRQAENSCNGESWQLMPRQLCNVCGQMVTNINRHVMSHTRDTLHDCPHCSIQMTDTSNLARHINAVHMKMVVKTCDECGMGFTHYNTYNTHMRSKHGIGEDYACHICNKIFRHKGSMKEHIRRVHTFESKFDCKLCTKRFKTSRALKIHGRVHSDNTPYACSRCPKRFKSGYARNIHQLTHTGITFSCELCNKTYRYKSLLNIHMRKFHPEEAGESSDTDQWGTQN